MLKAKAMQKPIFALLFFTLLASSNGRPSSSIGINYGRLGNNLPSAYETIEALKAMRATQLKIYDSDHEILKLLSGTYIRVTIMVRNEDIPSLASNNQTAARRWVHDNVLEFLPGTMIRGVLVGNEVLSDSSAQSLWLQVVPAMKNIKKALNLHNIHNIKVGTPVAMDIVETTFPPSSGRFRADIPRDEVLLPLLNFLNRTRSYFFLDVYPYFSWAENPSNVSLDFALFRGGNDTVVVDSETGLVYTNLLDQMLDSVIFAMQYLGFSDMRIAISETGWPNTGDLDQPGASVYNAAAYNRNLVTKMMQDPPLGTPARPGVPIPTFLFALYDENRKVGPGTERHWGILRPSGRPVYELNLTGAVPETEYPPLPEPDNNRPYEGNLWCVVATGIRVLDLGPALDFACAAGNGTCDDLAPGGDCYEPVSILAHANYAFSSFWAKYRSTGASCYFNGLATMTTVDPSHGACKVPSVYV
nr:probable glucan endo-1,3-beta-glucosidase A6 [Ipomoea batatas]